MIYFYNQVAVILDVDKNWNFQDVTDKVEYVVASEQFRGTNDLSKMVAVSNNMLCLILPRSLILHF